MSTKLLLKDLDDTNKPRERMLNIGAFALSDSELLAVLLGTGGKNTSAVDLANLLIQHFGSLHSVITTDIHKLKSYKYVGLSKAAVIKAVYEISLRIELKYSDRHIKVVSPKNVYDVLKKDLTGKKQEHLFLLSLDSRRYLIAKDLITIGSVNETIVPIRDVFRIALEKGAVSIILAHNHPSGGAHPSTEDIQITKRVADAAKLMEIPLIDHVILAGSEYVSIKGLNILNNLS